MLPQEPGIFSQALMGLGQPQQDPMAPPMDPMMGGMPPMGAGMGMDMGMGMEMPPEPLEDPSAEESRVVEDLIRNYLFEQGRKRMEATRQYQENVATQNEQLF